MQLIGIEEHYLTADVRNAWNAIGLAAIDPSVGFHSAEVERRLPISPARGLLSWMRPALMFQRQWRRDQRRCLHSRT